MRTREDWYEVTGIAYMEDDTEVELDFIISVEAEFHEAEPSVGYLYSGWEDTKDKADEEVRETLRRKYGSNLNDWDIEIRHIRDEDDDRDFIEYEPVKFCG